MDRSITELRRRILATVGRRLAGEFLVVVALLVAAGSAMGARSPLWLPAAVLAAQLIVIAHLLAEIHAGPLPLAYLRPFVEHGITYRPVRPDPAQMHPVTADLIAEGLIPVVGAATTDEDGVVFDVLQSANQRVTAAVGRSSGTATVLSRLADDRILVTTALPVGPHPSLILNLHRGASARQLAAAHRARLVEASDGGTPPITTTATLFTDTMDAEHEVYAALGPVVASLISLDPRRTRRLALAVDPVAG